MPDPRRAAAVREAFLLPLIFLTVTLLGGLRVNRGEVGMSFHPPPLIALLLAMMLLRLVMRARVLASEQLMRSERSPVENLCGAIVLAVLFVASAQVVNLMTPETGFLHFIFTVFFLLLLWSTMAARPDRSRLLSSLSVVFGGMFALKYIVLASLYDPEGTLAKRVLTTLLEGMTLGGLQYEPPAAATGYVAFATLSLYMMGLTLLPHAPPARHTETLAITGRTRGAV